MTCSCHGERAYWQADRRLKAGGWWECPVKRRQIQVDRYDRDPVYRIEKNLHNNARLRRLTIERRRAAHVSEQEAT